MAIHDKINRAIADGDQLNDGYFNAVTGLVPIGSVMAWHKSFTGTPSLPDGWLEANGQVVSDADSVYNGQTLPNLNASGGGTQRFLRGATTSGGTGGADSAGGSLPGGGPLNGFGSSYGTSVTIATLPSYFEIVWIIRIK